MELFTGGCLSKMILLVKKKLSTKGNAIHFANGLLCKKLKH